MPFSIAIQLEIPDELVQMRTEPKPTYSAVTADIVPASTASKCRGVCIEACAGKKRNNGAEFESL